MSDQLFLGLGTPPPNNVPGKYSWLPKGGFIFASTTWMLRAAWIEDFKQRVICPEKPALTLADARACARSRDEAIEARKAWDAQMIREKRASYVKGKFTLNEGEECPLRWYPVNARGEIDGRLSQFDGDIRIPTIRADGEEWLAGERGNSWEQVKLEVTCCELFPEERQKMLDWLHSSDCWEQVIIHRMLGLDDLGEEVEQLIMEKPLEDRVRENLEGNLRNMRRAHERRHGHS